MSLTRSVEALERKNFELEEENDALHEALSQALISLVHKGHTDEVLFLQSHDWWPDSHR